MSEPLIIDTGPLVAFLDRRDSHHKWAVDMLRDVEAPLLTCEAVIAEVCFLVQRLSGGTDAVLGLCEDGVLDVGFAFAESTNRIRSLLHRYANVPMAFADACIVRMSELHGKSRVMTLDSDFHVYRRHGRHMIPLITPGS